MVRRTIRKRKRPEWGRRHSDGQAYPKLGEKEDLPTGLQVVPDTRRAQVNPYKSIAEDEDKMYLWWNAYVDGRVKQAEYADEILTDVDNFGDDVYAYFLDAVEAEAVGTLAQWDREKANWELEHNYDWLELPHTSTREERIKALKDSLGVDSQESFMRRLVAMSMRGQP